MTSATESLKDLHQLHLQIEELQTELERGPMQIQARKKIVANKEEALDNFLNQLTQMKKSSDSKALELKTLEAKLEDLQGKLNAASSNREFDSIKGQIKADEMAKSVLEDEVLEILDRIDEESGKQSQLEQELESARQEASRFSSQFETRAQELKQELEGLKQKLQAAEKMLPSEPLVLYRRLVAQKGAKALAKVRGGACSNCFVSITAQQKILINSDAFEFCTNCGSLLYNDEQGE